MSIFDSIRNFSSSVVSGIGSVFSPTVQDYGSINFVGPPTRAQTVSPVSQSIANSVFSSISRWLAPDNSPAVNTSTGQQVLFLPSGGGGGGFIANNQILLLVIAGVLAGYLILKRK